MAQCRSARRARSGRWPSDSGGGRRSRSTGSAPRRRSPGRRRTAQRRPTRSRHIDRYINMYIIYIYIYIYICIERYRYIIYIYIYTHIRIHVYRLIISYDTLSYGGLHAHAGPLRAPQRPLPGERIALRGRAQETPADSLRVRPEVFVAWERVHERRNTNKPGPQMIRGTILLHGISP